MNETAPKKRRAWLWLSVLMPLAAVGTVALLLALGVLFKASGETLEPTQEERALLLDVWHLSSWMAGYTPDLSGERMTKTRSGKWEPPRGKRMNRATSTEIRMDQMIMLGQIVHDGGQLATDPGSPDRR